MQSKNSFFSSTSHELRTPLTLILGPLEDVLRSKDKLTPENQQKLTIVQRHATRLLNMVNKVGTGREPAAGTTSAEG